MMPPLTDAGPSVPIPAAKAIRHMLELKLMDGGEYVALLYLKKLVRDNLISDVDKATEIDHRMWVPVKGDYEQG
jgi:hypothetical protein